MSMLTSSTSRLSTEVGMVKSCTTAVRYWFEDKAVTSLNCYHGFTSAILLINERVLVNVDARGLEYFCGQYLNQDAVKMKR